MAWTIIKMQVCGIYTNNKFFLFNCVKGQPGSLLAIHFRPIPLTKPVKLHNIQSESDIGTSPVIESSILPITGHAIAIG
jgi:rRNA maturation protein Rpf1